MKKYDINQLNRIEKKGVTSESIVVYKSVGVITGKKKDCMGKIINDLSEDIVVSLTIPKGSRYFCSDPDDYDSKWRFECAHVNHFIAYPNIIVKDDIQVCSHYDESFTYSIATTVRPKNGFDECEKTCGGGIHAFKNIESAWNYQMRFNFYVPLNERKNIRESTPRTSIQSPIKSPTQSPMKSSISPPLEIDYYEMRKKEEEDRRIEDEEHAWNSVTNHKELFKEKFIKSKK